MSEYFFGDVKVRDVFKTREWLAVHFPSVSVVRDAFDHYCFSVSQGIGDTHALESLENAIALALPPELRP